MGCMNQETGMGYQTSFFVSGQDYELIIQAAMSGIIKKASDRQSKKGPCHSRHHCHCCVAMGYFC